MRCRTGSLLFIKPKQTANACHGSILPLIFLIKARRRGMEPFFRFLSSRVCYAFAEIFYIIRTNSDQTDLFLKQTASAIQTAMPTAKGIAVRKAVSAGAL